jgi:hypothetical protein
VRRFRKSLSKRHSGVILEKMEKAAPELDDVLKNIVLKTYE